LWKIARCGNVDNWTCTIFAAIHPGITLNIDREKFSSNFDLNFRAAIDLVAQPPSAVRILA